MFKITSVRLVHCIILFRAEWSCGVPGKMSLSGSSWAVDSMPQRLPCPPLHASISSLSLLHSRLLRFLLCLPFLCLDLSLPFQMAPSHHKPWQAASHLPLCLGVYSKCTSLGLVAASYCMWERSQLGHSLMNHFLQDTVRKSLSEFGVSNQCSLKQHECPLLSVVKPGTVCVHMCI